MVLVKRSNAAMRWVLLMLGCLVSGLALGYTGYPYPWIFLTWSAIFLVVTFSSHSSFTRALWVNLSVLFLILGAFEGYLAWDKERKEGRFRFEREYVKGRPSPPNQILGSVLSPDSQISVKKYYKDQLLYDVVYMIGPKGLRIAPPVNPSGGKLCIVFYGGSFMFGAGLNDHETLPYLTGMKTHGQYRIYNFGVSGHGPHHMLASLQHLFKSTIGGECVPKFLIYSAIGHHMKRAGGLTSWEPRGPRYSLNEKGEATLSGTFESRKDTTFVERIGHWLRPNRFLIYQKGVRDKVQKQGLLDLFTAIVEASKKELVSHYPASEFHVILWVKPDKARDKQRVNRMYDELTARGITVHPITEILPDYSEQRLRYAISEHDRHPNAFANEQIADYVVKNIICSKALCEDD